MQRGEHQTEFANYKVDKSSDADEQQPRGTSELHGPNFLASAILLLTSRQINALIHANFTERLTVFQELQSHDRKRVTRLEGSNDRQISTLVGSRTLVEILVRIAHVRVFGLVTNFRRELRVTAMDIRNVGRQQRLKT